MHQLLAAYCAPIIRIRLVFCRFGAVLLGWCLRWTTAAAWLMWIVFPPIFSNDGTFLARFLWAGQKRRTVGYALHSVTLPSTWDHANVHSVRTYTAKRTCLIVHGDNAEQEFTADTVASLNESNSSISLRTQHRSPPTSTSNRPQSTTQLYFSQLLHGWTSGWPPNSIKKKTAKEFSTKGASQALFLPTHPTIGDRHQGALQQHRRLCLRVIQTLDSIASRWAWDRANRRPIVETAKLQHRAPCE